MTTAAEPLRLVLVSTAYPPADDRYHAVLWSDIARDLVGRGHDVTVLTTRDGGRGTRVEDGVTVRRTLRERGVATSERGRASLLGTRHDCAQLRRAVRKVRADAVIFTDLMGGSSALLGVRHQAGVVTLCDATTGWMDDVVRGGGLWFRYWAARAPTFGGRLAKGLSRSIGAVFLGLPFSAPALPPGPVFATLAEPLTALHEIAPDLPMGRLVEPGIDLRRFDNSNRRPPEGSRRLLYTGPIAREYGLHTAVLALGDLGKNVTLRIVGDMRDPDYMGEVALMGRAAGVMDRVELRPQANDDELPSLLASADALVLTSHVAERFPRLVLRAFAAGTIVVGTAVGSRAEVLRNGETGLTFAVGNARELAKKLARLLTDKPLETRLAKSARELVEQRYSIGFACAQIERLTRDAAAAARPDAR